MPVNCLYLHKKRDLYSDYHQKGLLTKEMDLAKLGRDSVSILQCNLPTSIEG